ncbi:MAG: hypothetical protein LWW77_04725 [Propionibacteriales bacterium]|nr:hypothetical protein [Propionibacteriales bacterium]
MATGPALLTLIRSTLAATRIGPRPTAAIRPLDFNSFAEARAARPAGRRQAVAELVSDAGITRLAEMLRTGRVSAVELTLHYLDRIEQRGELRAFVQLNPDAVAEASASDQRRAADSARGPLDGIPLAIKDNIETAAPLFTTGGTVALIDNLAAADAPVVAALRAAGAVILGKANLSELAGASCRRPGFSAVGGLTINPYGSAFTPGGSSSGSAVAVAAGLCAAAIGTETSGSLIAPASFNGVVAVKPTYGLVPGTGVIPLVAGQDCVGPVTVNVADAALLLAAMAGLDPIALPTDGLAEVTAGILAADISAAPRGVENTADNDDILTRLRDGLSAAGAQVVDVELAEVEGATDSLRVVLGGLAHDTMGYLAAHGGPSTLAELAAFNLAAPRVRMPRGQFFVALANLFDLSAADYEVAAGTHTAATQTRLRRTFDASGATVLVSLSNLHSEVYAGAGYPAMSVPLGLRRNGMPVGATLIGRPGRDAELLAHAAAFERATRLRQPPASAG